VTWLATAKAKAIREREPDRWIIPGVTGATTDDADACYRDVYGEFRLARISIFADAGVKFKPNGFRRTFGTHLMATIWSLERTADVMGSDKVNMAPHYMDIVQQTALVHSRTAAEYFRVGRPGAGDFSKLEPSDWLPSEFFRSQAEARREVEIALTQLKSSKAAHRI
jgi:hypothetical protein